MLKRIDHGGKRKFLRRRRRAVDSNHDKRTEAVVVAVAVGVVELLSLLLLSLVSLSLLLLSHAI